MVEQNTTPWEIQFSQEASEQSQRITTRSAELRLQASALFANSERIREASHALREQFAALQQVYRRKRSK